MRRRPAGAGRKVGGGSLDWSPGGGNSSGGSSGGGSASSSSSSSSSQTAAAAAAAAACLGKGQRLCGNGGCHRQHGPRAHGQRLQHQACSAGAAAAAQREQVHGQQRSVASEGGSATLPRCHAGRMPHGCTGVLCRTGRHSAAAHALMHSKRTCNGAHKNGQQRPGLQGCSANQK